MNNYLLTQILEKSIAIITLNRPEQHNAFDDKVIKQLNNELVELEKNEAIQVVMLNANGKNFSAGADLDWMKRMIHYTEEENIHDAMQLVNLLTTLSHLRKPTIGLTQGLAIGGGVGLLSCCDIVIADQNARFCFTEAKLGLIPATIAPYVIRAVGERTAQYYFLTTKSFSAKEALHIGLIHDIISDQSLLSAGMDCARSLLKNGPQALQNIKRLVLMLRPIQTDLVLETAKIIAKVRASAEAQEGLNAFFDKREPNWINNE